MAISVFEYAEPVAFLRAVADSKGKRGGVKTALAKAMQSHPAYLSRVLAGHVHLNLEQAEGIARFLELDADERRAFFYLVEEARAGTAGLKKFFREERALLTNKRREVRGRIPPSRQISPADQAIYYSAWHYSAIHVASSIGTLQTAESLAAALNLPLPTVREALAFLDRVGILEVGKSSIKVGSRHIHVEKSSPFLRTHHANWRQKSVASLDHPSEEDLRYTAVFSLSRKDAATLREKMLSHLKEYLETVASSPEETAYVFCWDFFSLLDT